MQGGPYAATASSATKELDDLMASLSDFKVCVRFYFIIFFLNKNTQSKCVVSLTEWVE